MRPPSYGQERINRWPYWIDSRPGLELTGAGWEAIADYLEKYPRTCDRPDDWNPRLKECAVSWVERKRILDDWELDYVQKINEIVLPKIDEE